MSSDRINSLRFPEEPENGAHSAISGDGDRPSGGDPASVAPPAEPKIGRIAPAEPAEIITHEGFDRFARQSRPRVIRFYCSRRLRLEDAEDQAQEAFLLHWRKRHSSLSPHLAFLLGIARRLYFAFLRS